MTNVATNFQPGIVSGTKLWVGTANTSSQSITATTPTNLPTPVNLTFTPSVTGKYRVYANVPAAPGASSQMNLIISPSAGSVIQEIRANIGVTTDITMAWFGILITLTANTSYTFNIQCWVSNATNPGAVRCDRPSGGVAVIAELIEQTA